jgi:hypothetical protein
MADITNCPFDITPLSQSEVIDTQEVVSLNYTNQDFASMKVRLIDFIRNRFTDKFNDFIESDLAIMLIENWSFIADTLSFKMDQIANEIFIDTVSEVENAFRLAKLVGFEPTPPIAARSLWSATINTPLTTDLSISTPVLVESGLLNIELFQADSNNNPLFDEPIIISSGNLINESIVGLEGLTIVDVQEGSGESNQTVELSTSPVIFDSVRVNVDGTTWERVDFFTDSQPRREFRVEFNSDYEGFVVFGNDRAGLAPSRGSRIEVTYRSGGGEAGNIVTGFIEAQRTFDVPNVPFKVPVIFRNFTAGKFGYDGDGVDEIRENLPKFLRTQDRAVTGLDYKTLADLFKTSTNGQIGKSTAVLRNHGCAGNVVDLYVLAREGSDGLEEAEDELKAALQDEIDEKKMLTDFVCIRDGSVILVDVNIDITVDKINKKFEEEIRERVNRRVENFFRLTEWEYNDDLTSAELLKALSDIPEPKAIDISYETDDPENSGEIVTARFFEIIRPDNINISFVFE